MHADSWVRPLYVSDLYIYAYRKLGLTQLQLWRQRQQRKLLFTSVLFRLVTAVLAVHLTHILAVQLTHLLAVQLTHLLAIQLRLLLLTLLTLR